jgi:hypothetical protein
MHVLAPHVPLDCAGMQFVTDRLANRRQLGNVLFALLGTTGTALTVYSFMDPEKGIYSPDVEFTNWSGTHSVTCKCATLLQLDCP